MRTLLTLNICLMCHMQVLNLNAIKIADAGLTALAKAVWRAGPHWHGSKCSESIFLGLNATSLTYGLDLLLDCLTEGIVSDAQSLEGWERPGRSPSALTYTQLAI